MPVLTLEEFKEHLSFTPSMEMFPEPQILDRLLAAAENHIDRQLGYRMAETYGAEGQEAVPPALKQAVAMLATYWFDQREAAAEVTVREVPFSVREIVEDFRNWSF